MVRNSRRRLARGFSMLELTFVLVIIGALLAVAAFNFGGQSAVMKGKVTASSMAVIKAAIQQYNLTNNVNPPTLNALVTARILEAGKLKDAWNRPFNYDPNPIDADRTFSLTSSGNDGIPGTADDIDVWVSPNP